MSSLLDSFKMTDTEMQESDALPEEVLKMSTDDLVARTRLLDNDCKVMRSGKIHFLNPFSYPLFYPLFTPLLDPFFGSGFGSISGSAFKTFFTRLSKTEKKNFRTNSTNARYKFDEGKD